MTVETEAQPEQVTIPPTMERILVHMLENPKLSYYLTGICRQIDMHPGTASPLLRRMEAAGWLSAKLVAVKGQRTPLKMYRFTQGSAKMLREAIR